MVTAFLAILALVSWKGHVFQELRIKLLWIQTATSSMIKSALSALLGISLTKITNVQRQIMIVRLSMRKMAIAQVVTQVSLFLKENAFNKRLNQSTQTAINSMPTKIAYNVLQGTTLTLDYAPKLMIPAKNSTLSIKSVNDVTQVILSIQNQNAFKKR
jgi:hypothetical protein